MIARRNVRCGTSAIAACCALLALALFSSAPNASAANAGYQGGYVHEESGLVSITRVAAKALPAKTGDVFGSDTVFRTGPKAKMILKFADGQVVLLGANSAVRVGRYHYSADNPGQNRSTIELMSGKMRFVSGLIGAANPEGLRIFAGNSSIDVLSPAGADFTLAVKPDPQEVGAAVVALGEISVRTPYGPISEVEAGQYAPWQPGRNPPPPMPFAAAPAVVQAGIAGLWETVLPANTPVEIESAARTAGTIAASSRTQAGANTDTRLAGFVEAVSNEVSMHTAASGKAAANVGTTFAAGTTFNTGADGRVVLKFADGQLVVLGPASVLAVDQYQFDPSDVKASSSAIDLVNGAMRVVSGDIQAQNPAGVSISAGASIVDVLNTGPADFTVAVTAGNQEVGVARVALGEISVHTPYGPIDKIPTDQSNLWGPGTTPATPIPSATALAVVQAAAALQLSGLPDNTPVAVAPAASAAAAQAAAKQAQTAANADPQNAQLRAAAQAATELADLATQTATAAAQAVAATEFASALASLPASAAGPALAQVPAPAAPVPPALAPLVPTATPGAGGACTGSPC